MKILRNGTSSIFVNFEGKALKLQDDNYVEPDPNALQIEVQVDAGQVFTIPTTTSFSYMNTSGTNVSSGTLVYDYYVDWGDGSAIAHITTYNSTDRIHTYVLAGKYIITITSPTKKFPVFDCNDSTAVNSRLLITRVISWGDVGIKKINFYGCGALVTLPEQRSKLTTLLTAMYFCQGCTSLSAIPYGTFFKTATQDIVIADFSYAFYNCTKLLSIHSTTLVDCIYARSFSLSFGGCTRITTLPDELFYSCPNVTTFAQCFTSCTSLVSIPATLFLYNTASPCNFSYTFYNCSSLVSIPAHLFDTVHSNIFYQCFYACNSLTTIPEYLFLGQNLCTSFYQCFYACGKLKGVPTGVFDISVNGVNNCTDMSSCFISCGTDSSVTTFTIADNLFDDLYRVTSFYGIFNGCTKFTGIPTDLFINCIAVTDFSFAFASNKHTAIPSGLFDSCTEVTNFQGTFYNNTLLTSAGIPESLFYNCTKAILFGGTSTSYGTFSNCNNVGFTYIPATLFKYCINATNFGGCFYNCANVTTIPVDLLRYNTSVTDVNNMFAATKISSLSSNVFQYNPSITTVYGCFTNCTLLASIDENIFNTNSSSTNAIVDFSFTFSGCNNVGLTSIPANLFRYSINAKLFYNTFSNCNKITSIPSGLFQYNLLIENLYGCFNGWIMTSIPSDLFAGLTQVNTVQQCFYYCHELLSIPSGLFDSIGVNRSVNFTSCFQVNSTLASYNKITGAVPELWNKPNNPVGVQCFRNRTAVSNYASIPAGWK